MKHSLVGGALLVGFSIAGCGGGSGQSVQFAPAPGIPAYGASTALYTQPNAGLSEDWAPPASVRLGVLSIPVQPGKRTSSDSLISALQEEAQRRGATVMVLKGCLTGAPVCEGILFRTGPDVAALASQSAPPAGVPAVAPSATTTAQGPSSPAAAPVDADMVGLIPDNPALGKALIGIWMPDASGSIPESARPVFEAELIRSILYVDTAPGANKLHQGNLVVYTDAASVMASGTPSSRPLALTPTDVFEKAIANKIGLYIHHEGAASVFTTYTTEEVRDLLASTKKKP